MEGKVAVISGFSGAGKGTVVKKLMAAHEEYALSVSMTTRKPREGEKDGREYHFVTNELFEDMIRRDGLLEHAGFTDCYYGTPAKFVEDSLKAGKSVLLEIEVQGAMQIIQKLPQAVLIFVAPPDAAELEKRLVGRGTETEDKITKRLRRAVEETEFIREYPYLVINDDADACAGSIHRIISGTLENAAGEQGRIITDPEEKEAVALKFREDLPGVLARRNPA